MPRTLALNSHPRLPSIPAASRAAIARNLSGVAVTIVAICAIALEGGRVDEVFESAIPGKVECGHDRPAEASRPLPGSLDEKRAEHVPVWKTIILGAPDGIGVLRANLDARCRVGGLARAMLDTSTFSAATAPTPVDLVVLSAAKAGLEGESVPRAAIDERARRLGLTLCPAEVGPQLRLQYADQPRGEFLHVAMEPMVMPGADHAAFAVGNGNAGLLLIGENARSEDAVSSRTRFVFIRPR